MLTPVSYDIPDRLNIGKEKGRGTTNEQIRILRNIIYYVIRNYIINKKYYIILSNQKKLTKHFRS